MNNFLLGRVGQFIARWRRVRNGVRGLERLDDRMLADIGIARAQIYRAVRDGREH